MVWFGFQRMLALHACSTVGTTLVVQLWSLDSSVKSLKPDHTEMNRSNASGCCLSDVLVHGLEAFSLVSFEPHLGEIIYARMKKELSFVEPSSTREKVP